MSGLNVGILFWWVFYWCEYFGVDLSGVVFDLVDDWLKWLFYDGFWIWFRFICVLVFVVVGGSVGVLMMCYSVFCVVFELVGLCGMIYDVNVCLVLISFFVIFLIFDEIF